MVMLTLGQFEGTRPCVISRDSFDRVLRTDSELAG